MAADTYDLTIDQGADWFWTIRWKVGPNQRSSVPKNTAGYTARMQVRRKHTDTATILNLTVGNGGVVVGSDGSFQLRATAVQTAAMPAGKSVYDVEAIAPNGVVTKLARGQISVVPEVTR